MTQHQALGRDEKNGQFLKRHGHANPGDPTYNTWAAMIARCTRPSHKSFSRYGGRGIHVCDRWEKFENFLEDMGVRPDGFTIGRIDNNAGYSLANCRWETMKEQQNNRRTNRVIFAFGKYQTLMQWAEEFGVKHDTLAKRIDSHGWEVEEAITTPVGTRTRWKQPVAGETYHRYFGQAPKAKNLTHVNG